MTNSLIPYSFVPGTKAMASEVNANFLALANKVLEAKQFTSDSIETFNETLETRLDEVLGDKLELDMSNSGNVSNCIVGFKKNIDLVFDKGVVTLKAGSIVTVPAGFESDGVTMKFNYVTIPSDMTIESSAGIGNTLVTLVYDTVNTKILARGVASTSGTSAPTNGLFYDITNNIVKSYTTSGGLVGQNYSLPFAYIQATNSQFTAVKFICNGFGYMGEVVWSEKGVKCLIPNGRNADGSFKNILYTTDKIYITNLEGQASSLSFLGKPTSNAMAVNGKITIRRWNVDRYFEQDTPPVFSGGYCKWYNTLENKMYTTSDGGATWGVETVMFLGTLLKTDTSGVSSFVPAKPISLVTREFVEERLSSGLFYSINTVGRSGYVEFFTSSEKNKRAFLIQWGKTLANVNASVTLYKAFENVNYITLASPSTDDIEDYVHCQVFPTSTTQFTISIRSNGGKDTSEEVCWLAIGV